MTANTKKSKNQYRNALLAKAHIAKKELCLADELYRAIIFDEFGVKSAANLSNRELKQLIARFETKGFRPKNGPQDQAEALKERIGQELIGTDLTERRFRGLVRKVCNVDDVRFCRDVRQLKRLLAVLRGIIDGE